MYQLGFVGFGLRSWAMFQAFERIGLSFEVAAIADPRGEEIKAQYWQRREFAQTRYYESDLAMYSAERLDGVFIGTRCTHHAQQAEAALRATAAYLFLEKPVCIEDVGYRQLLPFAKEPDNRVLVSFPLRFTPIVQQMRQLVADGVLGEITMVQAVNNVPYGSVYFNSWYRDPTLTGGLFMQKMTHDIDYIHFVLQQRANQVAAMESKRYYHGQHPAGLHCPECEQRETCVESSLVIARNGGEPTGDQCCFAVDTGNHDHASVLFKTTQETLISYNQSFVVKGAAARRGARFVGTKASAELDFYTNELRLDPYAGESQFIQVATPDTQHFGGDDALARAFQGLMNKEHPSMAGMRAGLASAKACLAAKESAETGCFVTIDYGF